MSSSKPAKPDVIVTGSGDFMAQALQRVTKSVPIVVSGSFDPVGAGLVAAVSVLWLLA